MTEPIAFTSATPRFNLPVLFAAQAQKEFFVNEAHAIIDAITHPVVQGTSTTAPASPAEGDAWIVAAPAEGDWVGHEDAIATFSGGQWIFVPPTPGMQAFDSAASRRTVYSDGWSWASEPTTPSGGSTVDIEARAAIDQVIDAMRQFGIFSPI